MRSKKAGKRLDKVEALLSNVIEQYASNQPNVLELLDSARESVVRAKATLSDSAPKDKGKAELKNSDFKRRSVKKSAKTAAKRKVAETAESRSAKTA